MKKKIVFLVLLILAGAGSYWAYLGYFHRQPQGLEVSGTIEATEVNLGARLPGALESVSVKAGDQVKKGQVVAVISRTDLEAQRERDALGVSKAEAQLADLVSGAREQEINDARATVNTAQANFDKANADFDRIRELHKAGAVPYTDLEKAETSLKVSKNQLESAKARLNLLESGSRPDQISAAKIEVERARAVLKATENLLEDAKIVSPIDGTVVTRNFDPGEYIPAGAPVVTVADLNDLWIKVFVSTDDLPRIRIGQQVSFTVSGVADRFPGTIVEIASKGEFTPKTIQTKQERTNIVYAVKVRIDNKNGIFKPGMPADVNINSF
ncbi:MAG: efflux RND transporter periplasmic adaptor subunit [Peptococcaceae bacterium]|nr:efflux RND transporter periplasmic adaptor subunit [Peptococcaceae bacterium]